MRIELFIPKEFGKKVREKLTQNIGTIESEEWDSGALDMVTYICLYTLSAIYIFLN